jgi:hypothetical protein
VYPLCMFGAMERRENFCARQKASTLPSEHPVRSEVSKMCPAGLLAHRSITFHPAFPEVLASSDPAFGRRWR